VWAGGVGRAGPARRSCVPTPPVIHPFLWWIQENTNGTILFMGRVVDPRSPGTAAAQPE
jgi:hypothetical protein